MITRSAKRKSMHLECNSLLFQVPGNEIHIQSQSSTSLESSGYVPPDNEQFQKSICNIHIHSPAHEISTIKLSMPGIQPLIHIYPNKVLKTLEFNIGNESRKLTRVLDDMEIPVENYSRERNYLELDSNTSSQRCLTDNVSEDTNEINNSRSKNSKDSKKSNGKKNCKNNNHKTFKNSKEISSYTFDINSIKLNKAVVVLTDICKTKYYKSAFADYTAKDKVKNYGIETKIDISNPVVKQESLKNDTEIIDECCTSTTDSTFDTRPSLESVNTTPLSGSRLLTQLAEGCSFSEILNRFRIKNGICLVDTLKPTDNIKDENFNTECVEVHDDLVLKSETCSLNEDEGAVEDFLLAEVAEKINSTDFEESDLLDLPQGSEYEESREDTEHLRDQSLNFHMGSDHNENTPAVQSISGDVSIDEETVDSSCLTSNVVCDGCNVAASEETCNISETSKDHLSNMNNSDLNLHESEQPNLEMDKEEMKGKKFLDINKSKRKKNKRSKSMTVKSRHSPSPKKMKQSHQKSETFHKKRNLPDDYIPLQSSGPTKFGVAVLNQIRPYVQHDAKDFKNKMLFGDRNKRVSSSQHLRIYKLKQKVNRSIRS